MHACPSHVASWWQEKAMYGMWNYLFPVGYKLQNYVKEFGIGFKDREIFIHPSCFENNS